MICPHWQYLITLDSDLKEVSRYVDIKPENFATFSIEFVRLILAAGSEIDVVAKVLCDKIDSSGTYRNINEYREAITNRFPNFYSMLIDIPQYELQLTPWDDWNQNRNPSWWTAYNSVKHKRDRNFHDANLENTINAVAGLFTMIWHLHSEDSQRKKLNKTVLFSADRYIKGFQFVNNLQYVVPDDI
ncbi:MAG: hypothetical protein ISS63_04110 [Desulfobacteraceae bacterium]|nr:hypothetical protein [Desulfobacteraceae bacterium]